MTLSDWKSALEGVGIRCGIFSAVAGDVLQVKFPGPKYRSFLDKPRDGWATFDANFREAVMKHVWGEFTWFEPDWDNPMSCCLKALEDHPHGQRGYGPTKNDALYNALLAEGARRRG